MKGWGGIVKNAMKKVWKLVREKNIYKCKKDLGLP